MIQSINTPLHQLFLIEIHLIYGLCTDSVPKFPKFPALLLFPIQMQLHIAAAGIFRHFHNVVIGNAFAPCSICHPVRHRFGNFFLQPSGKTLIALTGNYRQYINFMHIAAKGIFVHALPFLVHAKPQPPPHFLPLADIAAASL